MEARLALCSDREGVEAVKHDVNLGGGGGGAIVMKLLATLAYQFFSVEFVFYVVHAVVNSELVASRASNGIVAVQLKVEGSVKVAG